MGTRLAWCWAVHLLFALGLLAWCVHTGDWDMAVLAAWLVLWGVAGVVVNWSARHDR